MILHSLSPYTIGKLCFKYILLWEPISPLGFAADSNQYIKVKMEEKVEYLIRRFSFHFKWENQVCDYFQLAPHAPITWLPSTVWWL